VDLRVGAGVKNWVGGAVGDKRGEAGLVPEQAERIRDVIPRMAINIFVFIFLIFVGFPIFVRDISRDSRTLILPLDHSFGELLKPFKARLSLHA